MSTIVDLTGISSGNVSNTNVTVTAVVDRPELFSSMVLNYVSPNTTGRIVLEPFADVEGDAVIVVTVKNSNPTKNTTSRTFKVSIKKFNYPTIDPIADIAIYTDLPLSSSSSVSNSPSSSISKSMSSSPSSSKSASVSSSKSSSRSSSVSRSPSSSVSSSPSIPPVPIVGSLLINDISIEYNPQ